MLIGTYAMHNIAKSIHNLFSCHLKRRAVNEYAVCETYWLYKK